jgi:hypothetical protein
MRRAAAHRLVQGRNGSTVRGARAAGGLGKLAVGLGVGGVLDLILRVRQLDAVAGVRGLGDGREADLGAEQARLDGGPLGLAGITVEVDVGDRAELLAVAAVGLLAPPRLDVIDGWHALSPVRSVV